MPVRLDIIPDAEPYPESLKYTKWVFILILLLSAGVIITSIFGSDELAKDNKYFWGLACGVPTFIWFLAMSIRWLVFITLYIRAEAWNSRREEVILQELRRGRRALQILHVSLLTALDRDTEDDMLDAFLTREQTLIARPISYSSDWVRHSVIPVLNNETIDIRLSKIFSQQFIDIKQQLAMLSDSFQINVLQDIHTPLSEAVVSAIWKDEWQKAGLPITHPFSTPESGLAAVDNWLDNHIKEKAVLLVISVYLEPKNLTLTAESVNVLLLANQLTQDIIISRALLHRPERITAIQKMATGINQALDWMPVQPQAIFGMWTAELNVRQRAALLSLNQPFCQGTSLYELDAFLGHSGPAAPWLSVSIAALAAIHLQQPQLTLSGVKNREHLWAAVVSPYVLPE